MVKNKSELENIVNQEVLDVIDKYHKHLATELSINIQFGINSMKFRVNDFYRIIKKINFNFQKELVDIDPDYLFNADKSKTK